MSDVSGGVGGGAGGISNNVVSGIDVVATPSGAPGYMYPDQMVIPSYAGGAPDWTPDGDAPAEGAPMGDMAAKAGFEEEEKKKKKKPGFLRNLIGIIGDSFLINDGKDAIYTPRLDSKNVANAAKGFTQNPAEAAERVAEVGIPKSMETAQTIFKNATDANVKTQNADSLAQSRQSAADNRIQNNLTKVMPYVGPLINGARDQADYSRRYDQAGVMLKRQGLSQDDAGLPRPKEWDPSMTSNYGMTAKGVRDDENADLSRGVTENLGKARIAATTRGQDVSAETSRANTATRAGVSMRGQDHADTRSADAIQARRDIAGNKSGKPAARAAPPPVNPAIVKGLLSGKYTDKQFDEYVGQAGAARAYKGGR